MCIFVHTYTCACVYIYLHKQIVCGARSITLLTITRYRNIQGSSLRKRIHTNIRACTKTSTHIYTQTHTYTLDVSESIQHCIYNDVSGQNNHLRVSDDCSIQQQSVWQLSGQHGQLKGIVYELTVFIDIAERAAHYIALHILQLLRQPIKP